MERTTIKSKSLDDLEKKIKQYREKGWEPVVFNNVGPEYSVTFKKKGTKDVTTTAN